MSTPIDPEEFAELVDPALYSISGSVFYSGRSAFSAPSPLYVLGLNPGGSPTAQAEETIGHHLDVWRKLPAHWSAYRDDPWRGAPGTYGIQPRMLHMFDRLGLDIREVPASNVLFVRSSTEGALDYPKAELLARCWPVHQHVIRRLRISTILCLGGTAGRWVRTLMRADRKAGEFIESNRRGWTSEAHLSGDGTCVITVTHPGRADWRNPAADPTPFVQAMLERP